MRMQARSGPAAGFTLVELAVAVGLFALVLLGVTLAGNAGHGAFQTSSSRVDLDAKGRRALERAVAQLQGALRDSLEPDPAGVFGTHVLEFTQALPFGVPGPAPRLRLELDTDTGQLLLIHDPDGPGERSEVLTGSVRPLLAGETLNLADDNGNGLIDERGFNIHREGDLLTLRLSLEGVDARGSTHVRSFETALRLRN